MKDNLPRVYANPINKQLKNNLEYYVNNTDKLEVRSVNDVNVPKKISEIFASPSHVYKSRVWIKLFDNQELETTIVGKTGNYLLALNGDKISINNIANIEKI